MEKDVPDTKHTQQDNISFTKVAKFIALTSASDQPQIILCSLNRSSYGLTGWSSTATLLECIQTNMSSPVVSERKSMKYT